MRVLLQRNLFAEGNRYRANSNGTEIPDNVELPPGAKIWDGKDFVKAPVGQHEREALAKKSAAAVAAAEKEAAKQPPAVPLAMYDPRYRGPNSPESIHGSMPVSSEDRLDELDREKVARRAELARLAQEEKELAETVVPPKAATKPAAK